MANSDREDDEVQRFTETEGIASELVNTYYKAIKYGHDKRTLILWAYLLLRVS